MSKHVNHSGLVKFIFLTIFLLFVHTFIFSQTILVKGIVKDELTSKPIQEVNIKVYGTTTGTSTDKKGSFLLRLNKIPATLVITCVGYEDAYYDITDISKIPIEFLLSAKSYNLQQVDISSNKYSFLFKDKDYSVLDYELMGDNVLLLIFRYQLKRSELVLLNRIGDTLAISKLPEVPPALLFKDFLSNVHYFSKANNSYQCFFNEKNSGIEFLYKTTVDSIQTLVKPFLFKMSGRLYFQVSLANGFGTAIGYFENGHVKKYIKQCLNEKKLAEYKDDQIFYEKWNDFIASTNSTPFKNFKRGQYLDEYESRAHQFEFYNMIYPVIKTGENNIVFFNFSSDLIELMNENGKIIHTVPITFHKESTNSINLSNAGWRWGSKILTDDYFHDIYAIFLKNGMVKIQRIDLETGKLGKATVLPLPFPEKIEIYKGDAYFLTKGAGENEKWKLVKVKL
ncbi:MAG: carboxypeptidase-like regulatory domain-containing protein [Bacteroidetes bacterium]|nr:carboxypeptidase-like regulatory domain-containing protein [Bacteroidota bacterium]